MAAAKPMKFATIPADEVPVAPRGRKVELDADLTAAFTDLPIDQAINLDPKFGSVDSDDRQRVSGIIRKNWRAVRSDADCQINYGKSGVPHVRAKVAKPDAEATA